MKISAQRGASEFVLFTRYCQSDKVKEDAMSGACSMHGEAENYVQNFSQQTATNETSW